MHGDNTETLLFLMKVYNVLLSL